MNTICAKQNIAVKSTAILEGDSCFVYVNLGYLARSVQHDLLLYGLLLQEIVERMALDVVPFPQSHIEISSNRA